MKLHHRRRRLGRRSAARCSATRSGRRSRCGTRRFAALATRFRLVRYDRRGHGRSPVPPGPYSIEDLGRDALDLLDELEHRARIVLRPVDRRRRRHVARLGGAGAGRPARPLLHRAELPAARAVAGSRGDGSSAGSLRRSPRRLSTAGSRRTRPPRSCRRSGRCSSRRPPRDTPGCCEALAEVDLSDRLAAIEAPTLVVNGAEDPVAPPEAGARLAASISGARHVTIAGAAHIASAEQPSEFSEHVLAHLTEETR